MKRNLSRTIHEINPFPKSFQRPYIIAEAGVNHGCDLEIAKRLIAEAKEGGADAIKFQSYKAEKLAAKESPSYWDRSKEPTGSQYELFQRYDKFTLREFETLKRYCEVQEIEFLSTPFDVESAEYLNGLMDVFKISSSDITNRPFIEQICRFGKPVLLSTGASNLSEIQEAVEWVEFCGNPLALMHCVLNYPTASHNAHLGQIKGLKRAFPDRVIGYSDHTVPGDMRNLEVAYLLGAEIIEKHFTHDKTLPGNDHYHAMDKNDLLLFTRRIDELLELLGDITVSALSEEEPARANARRSLVAARSISKNTEIQEADLTFKRPASGISPKFYKEIIGKIAVRDVAEDEILQWEYFKKSS